MPDPLSFAGLRLRALPLTVCPTNRRALMALKDDMPLLARHEGVWDGTYRHYDAAGKLVDEHLSRILCRFPDDGGFDYVQTNQFHWTDGRMESRDIPARYRDGRIWWDNELIKGWATELPMDDNGRTLVLYWQFAADPDLYLYEMIQLSDCGRKRNRTWQWIRGGEIERRTAIDEKLVTRDWRRIDAKLKKAA
jgi:hypothetical protein